MEHENKDFQKHTVLKCIVKVSCRDMVLEPGAFPQIWQKHGCLAYELKGENELMRINYEDLVDKSFEGSCIVEVYDSYWDARKTIILSVQEIVVTRPTSPRKIVCNTNLTSEEEELSEEESSSGVSDREVIRRKLNVTRKQVVKKIFNFVMYLKCLTTLH